jgi:hypothetical protein
MTRAEHKAAAEELLADLKRPAAYRTAQAHATLSQQALAHALLATLPEEVPDEKAGK